jgi:hypothetical protein
LAADLGVRDASQTSRRVTYAETHQKATSDVVS